MKSKKGKLLHPLSLILEKNMNYDAIIIGGGHNGLVCAAFLAQARKKVLVLERRNTLGGAAGTEEIFPNYRVNTGAHDAGLFLPEIIEKLSLNSHGLQVYQSDAAVFSPHPDGTAITLWRDLKRTVSEMETLYPKDAKQLDKFSEFMSRMSQILRTTLMRTPPEIGKINPADLFSWFQPAIKLRRLGKREMMEFLRILPLSVSEFLDEWFESEALKGLLSAIAVSGNMAGPMGAGTMLSMLYHYTGRINGGFKSSWFIRGGVGRLSEALAEYSRHHGAEIRVSNGVSQIFVNDYDEAVGVRLENGEKCFAKVIISNLNPRQTFFELVGAPYLEPRFVRKVQNIRFRGSTAKLNLALTGLPNFIAAGDDPQQLGGHIVISPSVEYLERAYDDAKYGVCSHAPVMDIVIPTIMDNSLAPAGKHLMSINIQYAPYQLRDGDWKTESEKLAAAAIDSLAEYAPDLPELIEHRQIITPLDLETEYGLPEGSIYHGQMALDQWLIMRPVPGWGRYRTPVKNLYLCGAGTHPGGGVTGAPGMNAAREIIKDLK